MRVHTLILGAGPAGLACADRLAAAGRAPIVVESGAEPGGLMRGVERGAFRVDLGRKELYSRIPEVHALWSELLRGDYCPYAHRIGILHRGRILETSSAARGWRRGMPWHWLIWGTLHLAWSRLRPYARPPRSYEEHWHRHRGRVFAQLLSQSYEERFRGVRWADLPPPEPRALRKAEFEAEAPVGWWHPRFGTGQIVDALCRRIAANGGAIHCGEKIRALRASGGEIVSVTTERDGTRCEYAPRHVVSGLPLENLAELLGLRAAGPTSHPARRGVVLVYLFFDEAPRFPHAWLHVTCPRMRAGRIVNYAEFDGDMVPAGKTCLCVEYFFVGSDPLAEKNHDSLAAMALLECTEAGLIDPSHAIDHLVMILPGADPATTATDWEDADRLRLVAELSGFKNLRDVKRPGTDKATLAGIQAASDILARDAEAEDRACGRSTAGA